MVGGAGRLEVLAAVGKGMVRMFRKSIAIVVLMSFLSFLLESCAGEDRSPVSGEADRLEDELSKASEVQELMAIRDEIASRAITMHVTADEIRAAGSDARKTNELLGLTDAEAQARFERIAALLRALHDRYPALGRLEASASSGCEACDVDRIAASWEHYSKVLAVEPDGNAGALKAPARAPLQCKMRQLVIGFGVCAARSGGSLLIYALCSYGVFCGSCSGGAADVICG